MIVPTLITIDEWLAKQLCNLSFQVLDPSANHSKNEIVPCHQE
jgi:hypothetical protein